METVNFQCGNCGNLMAVGVEFLGQELRCPHCQQVVLAPADAVPPPTPPVENPFPELPPPGEAPAAPPPEVFDAPPGVAPVLQLDVPALPDAPAPLDGFVAPEPMSPLPAFDSSLLEVSPLGDGSPAIVRKPRDYSGRVNWFIPLVFLPLLLYALLSTAVASFLYMKLRAMPTDPFDRSPDWEGDTPGVRKVKPKLSYDRKFATRPLPEHLLVKLGQTIRVGDLEVTPTKVERRKIELLGDVVKTSPTDALVLHLKLKNLAADYAFTPLDNFFDRRWKPGNDDAPPLTLLQAGPEAFFGGPARWQAEGRGRQWLAGRVNIDREGLTPGAEQGTIVATDAWDAAVAHHLFGEEEEGKTVKPPYRGKLLWRVQLRRGLIEWKGRMQPATAVVGVEFRDVDYEEKSG